jgi:hypothetical protein
MKQFLLTVPYSKKAEDLLIKLLAERGITEVEFEGVPPTTERRWRKLLAQARPKPARKALRDSEKPRVQLRVI